MPPPSNPTPPSQPPASQPGSAAAAVKTSTEQLGHEIVDIQFSGKTITKIRVPKTMDIPGLYKQFEKDHAHVSEKATAFPTSFIGDLVNKHGAEQVDVNSIEATRVINLKVTP